MVTIKIESVGSRLISGHAPIPLTYGTGDGGGTARGPDCKGVKIFLVGLPEVQLFGN